MAQLTDGTKHPRADTGAFDHALRGLRQRWRRRRVMEALSITLAVSAVALLLGLVVMDHTRFAPLGVTMVRIVVWGVAALGVLFLVLPRLVERLSDQRLAGYLESHDPDLDALVLSAVEAMPAATGAGSPDPSRSAPLARRLVARAADRLRERDPTAGFERRRLTRAALACAMIVGVTAATVVLGPAGFRYGLGLLWFASADSLAANPYRIELSPGSVAVVQREDQLVAARARGFEPRSMVLFSRAQDAERWRQTEMMPGPEPDQFEAYLFNLENDTDYYVAAEGVASPQHRLTVLPVATVDRIDLLYRYPHRSGRPPELIADAGDIRAVRGTRVEVRVIPSAPLAAGRLRLNGGESSVELSARDGVLVATLDIEHDGQYQVELPAGDGRMLPASPVYAIDALVDTMPRATIVRPGRDIAVTSVEEVELKIRASDDVAVRNLDLVLWVNGGQEEVFPLGADTPPAPDVEAAHTLLLEDRALTPGDLIAYYVRAHDADDDPSRMVTTDIYFMQVRPFDRQFRRVRGGGSGGGGGQGMNDALAAQQRQLVIALFKLQRDRTAFSAPAFAERLGALSAAQSRIRERVDAIIRRLQLREIMDLSPALQTMMEELPKASAAMLRVEVMLAANDTAEALPPARSALLHLQRADAAFREIRVAQSRRGGGGAASDLANLFRLEMDKFRSQYEHVQRGRWEQSDRHLDETMRRLRELANRQRQELARIERRGNAGGSESQRMLAERVEAMLRELERLTRERPRRAFREALQAAREAAQAMRRAAAGDAQQSRIALERLRAAQRLLDSGTPNGLVRNIERALRQAESLSQRQSEIRGVLEGTTGKARSEPSVARVLDQKQQMSSDARGLESRLERLTEDAKSRQAGASRALGEAREALREGALTGRIERSRRMLHDDATAPTAPLEASIARTLDQVRERIESARMLASESEHAKARAVDALRALVRSQDAVQERLSAEARAQSGPQRGSRGVASGDGVGGAATGGAAVGGSGYRWNGADMADVRRRLTEAGRRLADLQPNLEVTRRERGDIEAVIQGLLALGDVDAGAEELAARHAPLLAMLKTIERRLRDEGPAEDATLVATERMEPKEAYRALVDEYYRRLSEASTQQAGER